MTKQYCGFFQLGSEWLEVYLDSNTDAAYGWMPDSKHRNGMLSIGTAASDHSTPWHRGVAPETASETEIISRIAHEVFEYTLCRSGLRYDPCDNWRFNIPDTVFIMTHHQMSEVIARAAPCTQAIWQYYCATNPHSKKVEKKR